VPLQVARHGQRGEASIRLSANLHLGRLPPDEADTRPKGSSRRKPASPRRTHSRFCARRHGFICTSGGELTVLVSRTREGAF
jgi:hypothetical protein